MLLDILLGECTLIQKLLDIYRQHGDLLGNLAVHQRLGEAGLIGLVVTVLAVAD